MKMKGNKILAVLIVLAMLTTVFVVINRETVTAGKRIGQGHGYAPGYNYWGNASNTKTLVYSPTVDTVITINTTGLATQTDYFLFKPWYNNSGSGPSVLGWYSENDMIYKGSYIKLRTGDTTLWQTADFPPVVLDRSGLWLIDTDETHNMNDETSFASFIWVNSSIGYTITSPTESTEIAWGTNSTLTVTVDPGSSADTNIYMDLLFNGKLIENNKGSTRYTHYYGNSRTIGIYGNITAGNTKVDDAALGAGNYTIRAYKDIDGTTNYDYGTWGYNTTHNVTATGYNHTTCGPWDPPERNATDVTFTITTGALQTTLAEANKTMYWNFNGEMDIEVKDSSGDHIKPTGFNIVNRTGHNISDYLTVTRDTGWLNISNSTIGAGGRWGTPGTTWATNYTDMKVYMWVDTNGDVTNDTNSRKWSEEWNGSVSFTIGAAPGTQFKWIDDDGTRFTGADNDGVIPSIPAIESVPLGIEFQIIGDDHAYFGDGGTAYETIAMENMTLTGNALFTGTLDKIPGVEYFTGNNTWRVPVIPTMSQNGGSIRIDYTWTTTAKNYGTGYATLSIGGTKYYTNGTVVTVDTSEFYIDTPQTFTLTVTDADGGSNKYGTAYLYYIGDTDGGTLGTPIQGHMISIDNGYDGYTLGFNTSQQRHNQTHAFSIASTAVKAPRNLTVYVVASVGTTTTYGYALVQMKPKNALKVHAEAIGAITTLMSGYEYSKFYINTTIAGINTTTYPTTADAGQMVVRILETESGTDVTNSLGTYWDPNFAGQIDEDYTVRLLDAYFTKAGEYTVYAYNNTATSQGNNGTLVIKQVAVDTTFANGKGGDFVWKHDDNISATFTITYGGQPIDGTLRIDNISDADTKYNRTWANTSFDGSGDHTNTLGNTSIEVDIVDGVITVNEITADYLPSGVSEEDITFWFKPTGGVYARAEGIVKVKVPTVTPDKEHIPLEGTTKVVVYVTGRESAKLDGVFVRLYGQGYDKNGTSSEGKVTFSVNPSSTGNISIDVGEAGRTVSTKIKVVDWTLVVTTNPLTQVGEGLDFTVTVTDKDTGLAVAGADVAFNGEIPTTDSTGTVTFTAPDVTSDSTLGITVTADGYPQATASIKVIYVPKLDISVDETVVAESTFEVTVSRDGNALIGATVTFEGKTYKTKAGGVATLTAPTTVGDYTITASFGTLEPVTTTITVTKKTGGIPGFELVTLIAAIGVALILLRRKRN
jgi:hypothetical protein